VKLSAPAVLVSNGANDISIFFSSMKNIIDTFGTLPSPVINDGSINLERLIGMLTWVGTTAKWELG
jgi:hypothetical protein